MSERERETVTGVGLPAPASPDASRGGGKAKPTAPGDTGSGSESHSYPSRGMKAGGSEGPAPASHDASRGGGSVTGLQKGAGIDRSQTHKAADAPIPNRVRVKQNKLIFFTTQLAVMLDSGVVLSDALDAIVEQSDAGTFRTVMKDVADAVKSGQSFSASLAPYPKVFNAIFISMVKASEASGKMVEMLRVLSEYLNFEEETKRRIKGALAYPIVMAIMAIVAMGIMMFFVLPKFTKIYEAKGAALPKITQILLGLSGVMTDGRKMMAFVTVVLLISVAIHYWLATANGRRVIDFVKIRLPILGTLFTDLVVTRSMRIMATMVNTGVSLLDAIEVIQGSCNNYYFQQLWSATDKSIRDGHQLSDSIEIATHRGRADSSATGTSGRRFVSLAQASSDARHRGEKNKAASVQSGNTLSTLLGPGIVHMLRAGERSGQLGQVSDKISVFYEKKLEASIKSATVLVEPLIIIILGTIIGTVAIGMLLPVLRISSVITH